MCVKVCYEFITIAAALSLDFRIGFPGFSLSFFLPLSDAPWCESLAGHLSWGLAAFPLPGAGHVHLLGLSVLNGSVFISKSSQYSASIYINSQLKQPP
jgi:hypothetical protein